MCERGRIWDITLARILDYDTPFATYRLRSNMDHVTVLTLSRDVNRYEISYRYLISVWNFDIDIIIESLYRFSKFLIASAFNSVSNMFFHYLCYKLSYINKFTLQCKAPLIEHSVWILVMGSGDVSWLTVDILRSKYRLQRCLKYSVEDGVQVWNLLYNCLQV
jgi:hypothetical protein